MIIRYTYGFEYNGILYGWKEKELYRLPQMIGKRFYPLRKCGEWDDKGYYLGADRKSFAQLKSMTVFINQEVHEIESSDVPF
jgi:hypothetical protein